MKKIKLILFALVLLTLKAQSQISISCDYKEVCFWNNYTEKYSNCKGSSESCLFEVNKTETMIIHTTDDIKSTYYVKSNSYEQEYETHTYNVVSDIGNKYIFLFDAKNGLIKIISGNFDYLIIYSIKSAF
jgi:hypothetical protein